MKKILSVILIGLLPFFANAQHSRVDSIINLLNKSNIAKGLDTLTFNSARQLIRTAVLTDAQIVQLEKVADQFKKEKDEDLCYAVKYTVLINLNASDKFKAIKYGKQCIQKLENSSTPRANYLAKAFLSQLRLPFRNSTKLTEGFQFYTEKLNQYKKANDSIGLSLCYYVLGGFYRHLGLYEPAMYNMKKSISFLDSSDFNGQRYLDFQVNFGKNGWINNSFIIADYYTQMGEYEKAKQSITGYEPTVWVTTKKVGEKVLVSVKDNGNGIPPKILDKIFQPFFTTKPTGQGTGLGLSLSYDIVKAHGGELKVDTKEARPDDPVGRGEGSTFIIALPI